MSGNAPLRQRSRFFGARELQRHEELPAGHFIQPSRAHVLIHRPCVERELAPFAITRDLDARDGRPIDEDVVQILGLFGSPVDDVEVNLPRNDANSGSLPALDSNASRPPFNSLSIRSSVRVSLVSRERERCLSGTGNTPGVSEGQQIAAGIPHHAQSRFAAPAPRNRRRATRWCCLLRIMPRWELLADDEPAP
jgi:hypothetical protein